MDLKLPLTYSPTHLLTYSPHMTPIERISEVLQADGYEPTLSDVEGHDPSLAPLIVPFRPDELGREMALLVEVLPREEDDTVTLIQFALIYPFEIAETEHLPELLRALFLLNRLLPVGGHGLCEQTPAVYFCYQLPVSDADQLEADVITEVVNMIGFTTRRHGAFIQRILAGEATCDELLEELLLTGVHLPPLFARALRESSDITAAE